MGLSSLKLISVEPVLLLHMVASFMEFGVMQDLIYTKVCLAKFNESECDNPNNATLDYNQREGSYWMRYTNIALTVPSIVSCLILGSWCSYYGAKVPLLLPVFGSFIANLINVILSIYKHSNVAYLLISHILSGILGGSISVITCTMSYVSQISLAESRTVRVGVLESMSFLGRTIGPFIGGAMLSRTSHAAVFALIVALNIVSFFYVLIRINNIKPTRTTEVADDNGSTTNLTCKEVLGFNHFVESISTCFRRRDYNRRTAILLLLFSGIVIMLCSAAESDLTYLFVKNKPLGWPYSTYSYYSGMTSGLGGLTLLLGLPLLRSLCSFQDTTFGLLGILSKMGGFILLSLSTTTTMMFLVPVVAMMSTFPVAVLRSMISKLVESHEYGKVFAFVASTENVCRLLGTVIFNSIYPETRSFYPEFSFMLCAGLLLIPIPIFCWFRRRHEITDRPDPIAEGYRYVD